VVSRSRHPNCNIYGNKDAKPTGLSTLRLNSGCREGVKEREEERRGKGNENEAVCIVSGGCM